MPAKKGVAKSAAHRAKLSKSVSKGKRGVPNDGIAGNNKYDSKKRLKKPSGHKKKKPGSAPVDVVKAREAQRKKALPPRAPQKTAKQQRVEDRVAGQGFRAKGDAIEKKWGKESRKKWENKQEKDAKLLGGGLTRNYQEAGMNRGKGGKNWNPWSGRGQVQGGGRMTNERRASAGTGSGIRQEGQKAGYSSGMGRKSGKGDIPKEWQKKKGKKG